MTTYSLNDDYSTHCWPVESDNEAEIWDEKHIEYYRLWLNPGCSPRDSQIVPISLCQNHRCKNPFHIIWVDEFQAALYDKFTEHKHLTERKSNSSQANGKTQTKADEKMPYYCDRIEKPAEERQRQIERLDYMARPYFCKQI